MGLTVEGQTKEVNVASEGVLPLILVLLVPLLDIKKLMCIFILFDAQLTTSILYQNIMMCHFPGGTMCGGLEYIGSGCMKALRIEDLICAHYL